jgi:protein disulfide-isomerase
MKNIPMVIILLSLLVLPLLAEVIEEEGLSWYTNIEEAQKSLTEGKTLFILFTGTDWCPWCVKLQDEILHQEKFREYATENLVLVKLDFLRYTKQPKDVSDYNMGKMEAYGVRGFPTVLLYDAQGNKISQTGYIEGGSDKFVKHIAELISDAASTQN